MLDSLIRTTQRVITLSATKATPEYRYGYADGYATLAEENRELRRGIRQLTAANRQLADRSVRPDPSLVGWKPQPLHPWQERLLGLATDVGALGLRAIDSVLLALAWANRNPACVEVYRWVLAVLMFVVAYGLISLVLQD